MTELEQQVAALEATKKELEGKSADLDKVKAETADHEIRKSALTKELDRVQADIAKAKEDRRTKDTSFQDKLRAENLTSAKDKFFNEFGYKPEVQGQFLEAFKNFDTQAVNADLIFKDMLKTHVAQNPDKYIKMEKIMKNLTEGSKEFAAAASASGFTGAGDGVHLEYSGLTKEDMQAADWAKIPYPQYQKLKDEGKV